jgi:predicted secreted protein
VRRPSGLADWLFAALLLTAAPAMAQTAPATESSEARIGRTLVALGETARREIRQDRLRLQLRIEQAGPDSARVQAELNRRMAAALDRARTAAATGGFRTETSGYWIHQERDAATRETRWRAAQGLTLIGTDVAAIQSLGAQLQTSGALAAGLSWELADDTRRALEDELTAEAIARLRARAATVAVALGGQVERIARLTIGEAGGERPPVMPRAMAAPRAGAEAVPIAAEPGTEIVQVAVQAEIAVRTQP